MLNKVYCLFLLIVIQVLLSADLYTQELPTAKELFVEAESYFLFEEYKDALPLYQKIIRLEPENYNVLYKIGICYLNDPYNKLKSIEFLNKASQHVNADYKVNNYREKQAPLEAFYYLAQAYRVNIKLDKAVENYKHFKEIANPEDFDIELVDAQIKSCELAQFMMRHQIYVNSKNAGVRINSRFTEKNPVLSGDEKSLVFTRQLQFYDGVFISVKDKDNNWSPPYNLTPDFGLDGNSYSTGISYNGDEIFVYRSDNFDGNLYSSKLVNNTWTKLEKLNGNINTKYWESHASPSHDGQYLYFTSNRIGGFGGLDIYRSKKGQDNSWGVAENLGPVINTPDNEESPFVSNQGRTIFFSSQGHESMGGYDIYISSMQNDGTWTQPKNMGYPLNTTDDDLFYCPTGVNSFGYYTLYDESTTNGLSDIYFVETYNDMIPRMFKVTGSIDISNLEARSLKKITVKILNPKTNEVLAESKLESDGTFILNVPHGNHLLVIEGDDIETYTQELSLSLTQTESLILLSPILLTRATISKPPIEEVPTAKPTIIAKTDYYAVSDGSPIEIELIVPRGSDLTIKAFLDDSLLYEEMQQSVKKHYTYLYTPKPGKNIIQFTATDEEGNVSTKEVVVTYYPPVVPPEIVSKESKLIPPRTNVFSLLATGALRDYLLKLNQDDFKSMTELYEHLVAKASQEGYTKTDVDKLFAIYFTQKDLSSFEKDLLKQVPNGNRYKDKVPDSLRIPLELLNYLIENKLITNKELNESLLKLLEKEFSADQNTYFNLGSYTDVQSVLDQLRLIQDTAFADSYKLLLDQIGRQKADRALFLSATTEDLPYFLQNLMVASSGKLREYLSDLSTDSLKINNSIDLVNHLFQVADKEGFTIEELIRALEMSTANKEFYLNRFNQMLTENATGNLKSQLIFVNPGDEGINTYEELLKYLLDKSQYKNYSRENIYKLFLDLIGIDNVKEFAEKLMSLGDTAINKALADTSLTYFSSPFELIQYLLASTQTYDFSESDINNLLIRMILERNLDTKMDTNYQKKKGTIWKNSKFRTSFVLFDIIILLLIILYILYRINKKVHKKQQDQAKK